MKSFDTEQPESRAQRVAATFARSISRGWLTLLAAPTLAVGAHNSAAAAIIICTSVVLDVLRNRFSWDLQTDDESLARSIAKESSRPTPGKVLVRRIYHIIQRTWWAYTLILIAMDWTVPWQILHSYLGLFERLYQAVGVLVPVIPRQTSDFIAHGYAHRAPIVAHLYTFDYLMMLLCILLQAAWTGIPRISKDRQNVRKWPPTLRKMIFVWCAGFLLTVASYDFVTILLKVDWQPKRFGWYIHNSDFYFLMTTAIYWTISFLFAALYRVLLFLRVRAFPSVDRRRASGVRSAPP